MEVKINLDGLRAGLVCQQGDRGWSVLTSEVMRRRRARLSVSLTERQNKHRHACKSLMAQL